MSGHVVTHEPPCTFVSGVCPQCHRLETGIVNRDVTFAGKAMEAEGLDLQAERALTDDLAAALATAIDLLAADDDIGVLNQIRGPLARYREARQ